MTRINVVPVTQLTDQHLMAEYRELPMVLGSARRSNPANYVPSSAYTLNKGHVVFWYNKKQYLRSRWRELIQELRSRGFNIDPASRNLQWSVLDQWDQTSWAPDSAALAINRERILQRISEKPTWYKYRGIPLGDNILPRQ